MLQLQRASAGSGKTFTLTKKFIWFLIAVKEKDGSPYWRLRTPRELTDGLRRILAITFTNKATNEMKLRIVQKLADLARAAGPVPLSPEERKKINYLDDFADDLGVDPREIGKTAAGALSVLLNEYSDFKVSTIDSFFQTVLRTFAYESNLNDTYQVEIDSDYIAAAAVNATLNRFDSSAANMKALYWLTLLMHGESDKGSKDWNVFQKKTDDSSIYGRLLESVKRLQNEDFKTVSPSDMGEDSSGKAVRDRLDEYFDTPDGSDPLRLAYERGVAEIVKPREKVLAEAQEHGRRLSALFRKNRLDPTEYGVYRLAGHLRDLPTYRVNTPLDDLFKPIAGFEKKTSVFKTAEKSKQPIVSCPDDAEMLAEAKAMYDAFSRFRSMLEEPEWLHWKVYAPQIPYLGLIGVVRGMMTDFLEENNTIQLGETNSMLRRIIGKDDAPFIYERLGARLNHFLIDEFQDTSRLQWENMLPLLRESESRGEDNLIIGDAKQSIYRFRNADPSLITKVVPEEFPERDDRGLTEEENTNWRSDRVVVEFNNYFFSTLMQHLAARCDDEAGSPEVERYVNFRDLYANVAQYPSHRDKEGYVEINFIEAPEDTDAEKGKGKRKKSTKSKKDLMREEALSRIPSLIVSLIDRGYRQSDIALLVHTKTYGREVIDALVRHNSTPGARRIEFISEESLLVSSAEAVEIIIGVLSRLAEAPDPTFNFYSVTHPGRPLSELASGFINEKETKSKEEEEAINAMLRSMQTVALPALVEAITEKFVPVALRRSQAVFIAALQDMVLEYTEAHAADVSSFLDWWKTKGIYKSISSPEGTDAVQIMTIHKSKGLEFRCVIIPFEDSSAMPQDSGKNEWKWVEPEKRFLKLGFPPYLPVPTTSPLADTVHAPVYRRFMELFAMDTLNAWYVAFTRAVNELYVFAPMPGELKRSKSSGKKSAYLADCLAEFFTKEADSLFTGEAGMPEDVEWDEARTRLTIGTPPATVKQKSDSDSGSARIIEEYNVDSSPSVLQYVESPDTDTSTQLPDADDPDPRSEGNLLHSVMAMVETPSDLPRALLMHKMRGLITTAQAAEWEEILSKAMAEPEVSQWFAPGWRVLNERVILFPRLKDKRPDRMMIAPDRSHAVIIDYKFGEIPSGNAHIRQVSQYMDALREVTHIHAVKGYVWYVRKGKVVPVS